MSFKLFILSFKLLFCRLRLFFVMLHVVGPFFLHLHGVFRNCLTYCFADITKCSNLSLCAVSVMLPLPHAAPCTPRRGHPLGTLTHQDCRTCHDLSFQAVFAAQSDILQLPRHLWFDVSNWQCCRRCARQRRSPMRCGTASSACTVIWQEGGGDSLRVDLQDMLDHGHGSERVRGRVAICSS
jgi:hypothetical protein